MSDETTFAESAATAWFDRGRAYVDPDGSFEEVYGRAADSKAIEAAFAAQGVPYRNYDVGGEEWLRSVGSK